MHVPKRNHAIPFSAAMREEYATRTYLDPFKHVNLRDSNIVDLTYPETDVDSDDDFDGVVEELTYPETDVDSESDDDDYDEVVEDLPDPEFDILSQMDRDFGDAAVMSSNTLIEARSAGHLLWMKKQRKNQGRLESSSSEKFYMVYVDVYFRKNREPRYGITPSVLTLVSSKNIRSYSSSCLLGGND
ncbi:hypothetical protein C5167_011554 [Papaver somniferum]|uniref:Uncharacterized protein n=1 Tax=Papaver somniferum TaxID=3469 RepID=A0A4Y7K4V8_PAPSO|nr:uncharacterized protein LOC113286431 isoform X2 [Papaver somniferum]RZC67856.1 hypothetical protein C5167_011554 [Papaver somniferum]